MYRGFPCIRSSGSGLFASPSYQQAIAELDIIVAEPLLNKISIENEILVVTKTPPSLLAYFSCEGVMEKVVRAYAEGLSPKPIDFYFFLCYKTLCPKRVHLGTDNFLLFSRITTPSPYRTLHRIRGGRPYESYL